VTQINIFGVATGEVENAQRDPGCPQRIQFKPVKWQNGKVIELPTYAGDADALAYAINDSGQVAGSSGECAPFNPNLQAAMLPLHPLRWEPDGSVTYLGTLGGTGRGFANLAININNYGHGGVTSAIQLGGLPGPLPRPRASRSRLRIASSTSIFILFGSLLKTLSDASSRNSPNQTTTTAWKRQGGSGGSGWAV
jgi:uncharacterized membrane protein